MDTFVENTGVADKEKATPINRAEHEQVIPSEKTGTPVTLLSGESDGTETLEQEPAVIIKAAPDEMAAGYAYAFGRR